MKFHLWTPLDMHSYDRRGVTAGLNGELTIMGNPDHSGTIYFKRFLTMPPSFNGAYLDKAIQNQGRGGLERILRAAVKSMMAVSIQPPPVNRKPTAIKITEASAGMDGKRFYIAAEADWASSLAHNGYDLAEALEDVARREGVTVSNLL